MMPVTCCTSRQLSPHYLSGSIPAEGNPSRNGAAHISWPGTGLNLWTAEGIGALVDLRD